MAGDRLRLDRPVRTSLVAFTLFPLPDFSDEYCASRLPGDYLHTQPLGSLDDVTAFYAEHGLQSTVTSGVFLQVFFNVVFFVPLGIFVAYRYRRGLLVALLVSAGVSLLIEATQGTGVWGLAPCPYRLADVDDLITNTAGGLVGWFIGFGLRYLLPDPRPVREDDLDPPTRRRRALAVTLDVMVFLLPALLAPIVLVRFVETNGLDASTVTTLISSVVSFALFVLIPAVRKDRAGPGGAATRMALSHSGGPQAGRPAARWSLLLRWLVRWVPFAILGLPFLVIALLVETVVSLARGDGRSLSDLLSRTTWITRDESERLRDEGPRAVSETEAGVSRP
jgi:glycopeptide antibiotics resistance protein